MENPSHHHLAEPSGPGGDTPGHAIDPRGDAGPFGLAKVEIALLLVLVLIIVAVVLAFLDPAAGGDANGIYKLF